jgi:predicted ABC-type ATPase
VPTLFVLGGVNGAGKSTLAQAMLRTPHFAGVAFLNADVNAARLRRERPDMSVEAANFRGLRMVAEATERLLRDRHSFMTETVLASAAHRMLAERADEARVFDNSVYGRRPIVVARARAGRVEFCRADRLPAVTRALAAL